MVVIWKNHSLLLNIALIFIFSSNASRLRTCSLTFKFLIRKNVAINTCVPYHLTPISQLFHTLRRKWISHLFSASIKQGTVQFGQLISNTVNCFRDLFSYSDCKALCGIVSWHSGDMVWNCECLSSVSLDIFLCLSCHWTCHEAGTASGQNCRGVNALVKESCLPRGSSEVCTKRCTGWKYLEHQQLLVLCWPLQMWVEKNTYYNIEYFIQQFFNLQVRRTRCVQ